jgi:hypothetical protein
MRSQTANRLQQTIPQELETNMAKYLVGSAAALATLSPLSVEAAPMKIDLAKYRSCDAVIPRLEAREAAVADALEAIPGAYALSETREKGLFNLYGAFDGPLGEPKYIQLLNAEGKLRGAAKLLLRDYELARQSGCGGILAEGATEEEQMLVKLRNWAHWGAEDSKQLYEQTKTFQEGETFTLSGAQLADLNAALAKGGLLGGATAASIEVVGEAPYRFLRAGNVVALETGQRGEFKQW